MMALIHCRFRGLVRGLVQSLFITGIWLALPITVHAQTATPPPTVPGTIFDHAAHGDVAALKQDLANGTAVDALDHPGKYDARSALIWAINRQQYAAAAFLLDHGANPDQSAKGTMALAYAYYAGVPARHADQPLRVDTRWLKLLLDHGANINQLQPYSGEPLLTLMLSEVRPDVEAIRFVMSYHPALDGRFKSAGGGACTTVLLRMTTQVITTTEQVEALRRLLDADANPNVRSPGTLFVGKYGVDAGRTPLTYVARSFYDDGHARPAVVAARLAAIDLLLAHGADPRQGGMENLANAYPADCPVPPAAPEAATILRDDHSNTALTYLLANTLLYPAVFDRLLAAAGPIQHGEIGFSALYYNVMLLKRAYVLSPPQAAMLEQQLDRLLSLGVTPNPGLVHLSADEGWNNLWTSTIGDDRVGLEYLPLYLDRVPDATYEKLLQAGADPAIRRFDGMTPGDSVIQWLIKQRAATKLDLLRAHPGMLARIPTWCGRSVAEIADALNPQVQTSPRLATPTGQAAKRLLLQFLDTPGCHVDGDLRRDAIDNVKRLDDADIAKALAVRADWH